MKKPLGLFLLMAAAGCAGVPVYDKIHRSMAEGNFKAAAEKVEKSKRAYSGRSALVYAMDRLMTEHLAGRYKISNRYAEAAHREMDRLFTKSLSGEAMSWMINDSKQDYRGEHYEQILVHLFSLINYAMLGDPEEALVEARRADLKFREHERVYGEKRSYSEDGLMRWLSGVMYEAQGDRYEALLDYRNSLKAFKKYRKEYGMPLPAQPLADAQRLGIELGESDLVAKDAEGYDAGPKPHNQDGSADLIALVYEGLVPKKETAFWDVPTVLADGTKQYFVVAYPMIRPQSPFLKSAYVETGQGEAAELELFEDIQSIAVADLADRIAAIKLKAVARATAKYQAARQIQKSQDSEGKKLLATLATNIFTFATEQADTRSWRTLPARIHVARLRLPPGERSVTLRARRLDGSEQSRHFEQVKLDPAIPALVQLSIY